MTHDSLAKFYHHQCNPMDVPSFSMNEEYEAHYNWPEDSPFFREGMEHHQANDEEEEDE